MASKLRPKGSYKDLLNISAMDFKAMTESEIRGIVNKLNDVANKRMGRIEQSGFDSLSSAYRNRQGKPFKSVEMPSLKGLTEEEAKKAIGEYRSDLKSAYLEAKTYLQGKTSTITGTRAYSKHFEVPYEKILGKPLEDASNYDQRYKTKKVLRKPVKKKIRDFWSKYDQFREMQEKNNPDAAAKTTDIDDVQEFEEWLESQGGDVSLADMEAKANEDYLEAEAELQEEDLNDYDEEEEPANPIQPAKPKRVRKGNAKQVKHKGKGTKWKPKISFEKISIFD